MAQRDEMMRAHKTMAPDPLRTRMLEIDATMQAHFPTAVQGEARVGLYLVRAKASLGPAWCELCVQVGSNPPQLVQQYRGQNLSAGCAEARVYIERACREALAAVLVRFDPTPDSQGAGA